CMSNEFFSHDISKRCAECKHVKHISGTDMFLCDKKGPVEANGYCRKYSYDILKRSPKIVKQKEFCENDFKI
ncbi:MAG: hypothetical protein KBS41_02865, partial [Oscillospiraceae bacterium]|nr:hypothetical protein [Candidatus Equicaccousia limihippi]